MINTDEIKDEVKKDPLFQSIFDKINSFDEKIKAELDMKMKALCLTLAIKAPEENYDNNGNRTGANPDKILKAAKSYYEFITGKDNQNG